MFEKHFSSKSILMFRNLMPIQKRRSSECPLFDVQKGNGQADCRNVNWNVVSFSDGLPDKGRGIPYFYLTTLDPTARNALKDQRSSLTISEYAIGSCGKTDPENPSCAKITLIGKLKLLNGDPKETSFAQTALFTKHPEMKGWPKGHNFQIFKIEIEEIFMINWFGGPKPLTVDQYLQAKMDSRTAIA
ncbi:PREDICTED: protein CREG1 isoform X2 [Nicotiana attenuata]|uniref:protein CREG1 isoform X2 n=1 Tax=Nicotiana attenuata TaxID=49451 RepID=UPI000905B517|nr:PREDICTED: protein CREG1 isoform X2 [Nicotiana attenuata]